MVPPSLILGSDIHQKGVFHYSVVGVSVLYLTPAVRTYWAVVIPPVADNLTVLRKSCYITDQKDSCAQSERISSNVQFSSSIVSPDTQCNSCYSCKLYGWYCTVTHSCELCRQKSNPNTLALPSFQSPPPPPQVT